MNSPTDDNGDASRHPAEESSLDRDNPWPGLIAFRESEQQFFFGRDEEARKLTQLVLRGVVTLLFGASGLGKTSILRAALFPRARRRQILPVYVRLDYSVAAPSFREQVIEAISRSAKRGSIESPILDAGKSLWELLQSTNSQFWSLQSRLVTPLIIFDQFEEAFTLGRRDSDVHKRVTEFLDELASLMEGRPPPEVWDRLNKSPDAAESYSNAIRYRILIGMREDFLPQLDELGARAPSLLQRRMRLKPMTEEQALEVVRKPAPELTDQPLAERIVRFVAGRSREGGRYRDVPRLDAEPSLEPALLSLVCRELNVLRQERGESQITENLFVEVRKGVLTDFYERSLGDLPVLVREFVEDRLVLDTGHRDSVALEVARRELGSDSSALDRLIDRRILRVDDRRSVRRIELTHDVLAPIAKASRDARNEIRKRAAAEEARDVAERRARETRRSLVRSRAVAAGLAILLLASVIAWSVAVASQRRAARAESAAQAALIKQREALAKKNAVVDGFESLFDVSSYLKMPDGSNPTGGQILAERERLRREPPTVDLFLERFYDDLRQNPRHDEAVKAELLGIAGTAFLEIGQYEKAQSALSEAVQLSGGNGSPGTLLRRLNNLAVVHLLKRDDSNARPAFETALSLCETAAEALPLQCATVMKNFGDLLVRAKQFDEGRSYLERSLDLREQHGDQPSHIAASHRAIARLFEEQGDLEQALMQAEKAHEIEVEGDDVLKLAQSHTLLGDLLRKLKRSDEALSHYEFAFQVYTQAHVAGHQNIHITARQIARVCAELGKNDEATQFFERWISELRAASPRDRRRNLPTALSEYATFLRSAGKAAEAQRLDQQRADLERAEEL